MYGVRVMLLACESIDTCGAITVTFNAELLADLSIVMLRLEQ